MTTYKSLNYISSELNDEFYYDLSAEIENNLIQNDKKIINNIYIARSWDSKKYRRCFFGRPIKKPKYKNKLGRKSIRYEFI